MHYAGGEGPGTCKRGQSRGQGSGQHQDLGEAGRWCGEVLILFPAVQDAPPHLSIRALSKMQRDSQQRQSHSLHSPVKLDLFPGITCSTLKKIFTDFIFTSRSPSSQGARPPSPLTLHPPRASSRSPSPPSCYNTRLCERNNVYSPSRMGGLEMKRAVSPSPRPRAALGSGRRRNSYRNANGYGRLEGSPGEGITVHAGGERGERKQEKGLGTSAVQGPSFFSAA